MEMVRGSRVVTMLKRLFRMLFSRENLFALGLCLIVILLVIVTADSSPQWIYQGF